MSWQNEGLTWQNECGFGPFMLGFRITSEEDIEALASYLAPHAEEIWRARDEYEVQQFDIEVRGGQWRARDTERGEAWPDDVIWDRALRLRHTNSAVTEEDMQRWHHRIFPPPKQKKARKPKPGYVYLIEAGNGLIKIGRSKTPGQRLNEIQNMSADNLVLLHTIHSEDYIQLERDLHEHFADKRQHGEWFDLDEEDIEWLTSQK